MTTEVKVGAFTLLGLILMIAMFAGLSDLKIGGEESYRLHVTFPEAIGLTAGNDVCYAGVKIGSVESVEPSGAEIMADLKINGGAKIPRASVFTITSDGVMGAKFVNIQPQADADMSDCLQPEELVAGTPEAGMSSMMNNLNTAVVKVQSLLDSMNAVLGNQETQAALKDISLNMRNITANIDVLSATLANMAVTNQDDIRQMARHLNVMTGSLMRAADNVEMLVKTFNGDGQTGNNLKEAIANLSATSKRIDHMASSLEGVVTDPQVAEDLKATLHNVRGISQRADKMMGTVSNIKFGGGLETMYSGKMSKWQTNMDLSVMPSANSSLRFGINDIGEENHIDLQGGMRSGSFGGRAGIFDSKAGVGVDVFGGDKLKFSVDAYDPNSFRLRSRLQYEIAPNTYLFTQVNDINRSADRAAYVGLRRSF
ncbi:MAG: MlaD family protein [Anaerovibrio sp.]|nr:MCE family protein [Selenomonadaceae bacterium]MDY6052809.1 MlaD family protein [Anaerovibrio sp.]